MRKVGHTKSICTSTISCECFHFMPPENHGKPLVIGWKKVTFFVKCFAENLYLREIAELDIELAISYVILLRSSIT